jgi:hypothetical protein
MKKHLVTGMMLLILTLVASIPAWAGQYIIVVPREPVVVYTPGAVTSTIVVEEPAVVIPYDYRYDNPYYGYGAHRYPSYHHGYRGPAHSRSGFCAPSRSGWGSSVGTWGRR